MEDCNSAYMLMILASTHLHFGSGEEDGSVSIPVGAPVNSGAMRDKPKTLFLARSHGCTSMCSADEKLGLMRFGR